MCGLVCLFPMMGCDLEATGANAEDEYRRQWLESVITTSLFTWYDALIDETLGMENSAEQFCRAPTAERLEDLKSKWWSSRSPWKKVEIFKFGPYSKRPRYLGAHIDSWPIRLSSVTEELMSSEPLKIEQMGVTRKEFPTIEYFLYGPEALADFSDSPRRCEYLLLLTVDLASSVKELSDAWRPIMVWPKSWRIKFLLASCAIRPSCAESAGLLILRISISVNINPCLRNMDGHMEINNAF